MIGFRDTNDFVDLGFCKHEFEFTCRGYLKRVNLFTILTKENSFIGIDGLNVVTIVHSLVDIFLFHLMEKFLCRI